LVRWGLGYRKGEDVKVEMEVVGGGVDVLGVLLMGMKMMDSGREQGAVIYMVARVSWEALAS